MLHTFDPSGIFVSSDATAPILSFPVSSNLSATEQPKQTANQTTKILHLINGEFFSGAERVQQLLANCLPDHGYAAHFAMLKPGKFGKLSGLAEDCLHEVPMQSRWDRTVVERCVELVRLGGFAALHAHTPRTALVAAQVARRTDLPWVYHVHSPTVRDSDRWLLNWINGQVERYSLRHCNALVTVSQSLRDEMLRRGVTAQKIFVVPNGVSIQTPIVASERIGQRHWRLGVVALFRARKGLEVLLEAFDELCNNSKNNGETYQLDIIGSFETEVYEASIRKRISSLSSRQFIRTSGFVTDVPQRMRELDLLVLPSLFGEGMPMVVLEALACGVPIVATRVEGTPEVIRHRSEGWLAQPRDPSDLADVLSLATASRVKWAEASAAASRRQRERFSDVAMSAAVADVYSQLLG